MAIIRLQTIIRADRARCFDLARSIDLHLVSAAATRERAVAGRTRGLVERGDTVTWQATHFGIRQQLTSAITALDWPEYFRDEQVKGPFKTMEHDHIFKVMPHGTLMEDVFSFTAPYGGPGRLVERFLLTRHLRKFLERRNQVIKIFSETDQGTALLKRTRSNF